MDLADCILAGDVRAAARLMRWIDDADPRADALVTRLFPRTGRARLIGVTGSPGTGKSTLIDALIQRMRAAGHRVGVVAVDPTSPFTGGAILGDRIRMQRHTTDPGVFIRSLATRGRLGGVSASTAGVVQVLDAMGYDRVVIETVGVGQDEIEIVSLADVVAVVLAPGLGDEVQAQKAGVLEIADVLVLNKADLPGADRAVRDLLGTVELAPAGARRPMVLKTTATDDTGVDELLAELERLLDSLARTGRLQDAARERAETLVADHAMGVVASRTRALLADDDAVRAALDAVHRRELSPAGAAAVLLARLGLPAPGGGR